MRKYRLITYHSLNKLTPFVDLGDSSYGEWIIYNGDRPAYHVQAFNNDSISDSIVNSLINDGESIENILSKINLEFGTNLSLGTKPFIEIKNKSELVELELPALPVHWLKNI